MVSNCQLGCGQDLPRPIEVEPRVQLCLPQLSNRERKIKADRVEKSVAIFTKTLSSLYECKETKLF